MRAEWIDYKGKKILYMNFEGLSVEEQIKLINESKQLLLDTKRNDNLTLINVPGIYLTTEFVNCTNEIGKITNPIVKKSAVVGVKGIQNLLLKAINSLLKKPRRPFASIEEAKEWLVE